MSFQPVDNKQEKQLHDLYYDDKMFVGRDRLWYTYKERYPDEKPPSQRATLDWLKKQQVHQQFTRPMKQGIVRPNVVTRRGYMSLDVVVMPNYGGYGYIFNCVDQYTKRYYALPFKQQTAENTIKFFKTLMERDPNFIVTVCQADNGSEFQEPFRSWAESEGIKLLYSKPHSPWSNLIERYGQNMKRMLFQAMTAGNDSNWVALLPTIVSNLNSTYSFALKNAPIVVDQSRDRLLHQQVAQNIHSNVNKRYGAEKAAPTSNLTNGDWVRKVYDYDPTKISHKASKVGYFDPDKIYVVTAVIAGKYARTLPSYKIMDKDTNKVLSGYWARWQLLKIPKDTVMTKEPTVRKPGPVEAEDNSYEVEAIVGKRVTRATRNKPSRVEYRIRWKGWNQLTYEDAQTIEEDVPELVAQYERHHGNR